MRPYLRVANVYEDRIDTSDVMSMNFEPHEYPRFELRRGDILLNEGQSKELVGRSAIYMGEVPGSCFTNSLVRFQAVPGVDTDFCQSLFKHYLRTGKFQGIAKITTNIAHLGKERFVALEFPLPPSAEQKRIVSKIGALQTRVSAAKEALNALPSLLEKFRQSVLAAAFRGDLTRTWREAHPDVEPATELLARIRTERRRKWEEANPTKKYVEPEHVDTEGLPGLPAGWCWASLDELASAFDYGTAEKSANEGRVPVLRMGNLQRGEIDWSDLKFTDDNDEIEKYRLGHDTLLFNRTNSAELVGKTSIYRGERQAIFAGYLIRIVLLDGVVPDFVNLNLNSGWGRDWCRGVKSDGVGQSNISAGKLKNYAMPLCPTEEQRQLVELVRAQLRLADSLRELVRESTAQSTRLDQSILAKAFRGELVPQDPNDEPAAVLLERIRAERKPK